MEIAALCHNLEQLKHAYNDLLAREDGEQAQQDDGLRQKVENLKQIYRRLPPQKEKPVTVPVIFGMTYNENFISDYLAYLLDPRSSRIGAAPLEAILREVFGEETELSVESIKVHREYWIGGRYIDLLIEVEDQTILVIENKIFAREGNHQTTVYRDLVTKQFPDYDHYFLFLTHDGRKAHSKVFQPLSYKRLLSILSAVPCTWAGDGRKQVFWDDFLTHLEVYIVKDNGGFTFSDRSRLYLENFRMIQDLEDSFAREWPQLIQLLCSAVQGMLHEQPGKWETLFYSGMKNWWHQVYKNDWVGKNITLHFEYYLPLKSFETCTFELALDVEGSKENVKRIRDLFDAARPELEPQFETFGFTAKTKEWVVHSNSRIQLGRRTFNFTPDLSKIDQEFADALRQYLFLVEPIDQVLEAYRSIKDR